MKQPELGLKIAELRKKKGWTQEELVIKCNLNVRTLQRIESGEVNPRSYTIKLIFEALEFDTNNNDLINSLRIYLESKTIELYNQFYNKDTMKNSKNFFKNYFLSVGIIWFLCALSIVIFKLNFQIKEILLTIIIPLGFAIFRQFDQKKSAKVTSEKTNKNTSS